MNFKIPKKISSGNPNEMSGVASRISVEKNTDIPEEIPFG